MIIASNVINAILLLMENILSQLRKRNWFVKNVLMKRKARKKMKAQDEEKNELENC